VTPRPSFLARTLASVLVALYPPAFRARFGNELRAHVASRWSRSGSSGRPFGRVRMLWDVVQGAVRERLGRAERGRVGRGGAPDPVADPGGWLDRGVVRDLGDALRRIVRAPFFAGTAVAIVTLGIGANTTAFTLVHAFLLRPPPYAEPERVVDIYQDSDDGAPNSTSFPAYEDIAATEGIFESVAATLRWTLPWQRPDETTPARVEFVTSSYFPTLGLPPARGRGFSREHDVPGAGTYALVGYRTWQSELGGDPDIVGQTVRINGRPVTVVGVAPEEYAGYGDPEVTDFFLSISSVGIGGDFFVRNLDRREDHWYQVQARLADGVTIARAQDAMDALATRLAESFPEVNEGRGITVFGPGEVRLHPEQDAQLVPLAAGLLAVSGLLLVLACANLANLLLVRGIGRSSEVAVRRAMGAGRWRVARIFLFEAFLLASIGGIGGVLLARWALSLAPLIPTSLFASRMDLAMDPAVFAATGALVGVTALLFGLAPALQAGRSELADTLREQGRTASASRGVARFRSVLVAVQVSASLVLLAGAGLAVRSLMEVNRVDPGVEVERLAWMSTSFQAAGLDGAEGMLLMEEVAARVESLPGVASTTMASRLPVQSSGTSTTVVEDYDPPSGTGALELSYAIVDAGYFETMGIPVLEGRGFEPGSAGEAEDAVIVSRTAAERFWPGDDATRGRLRPQSAPEAWSPVVGVVGDTRVASLEEPPTPLVYRSLEGRAPTGIFLVVRAEDRTDPSTLLPLVRRELEAVSPALAIAGIGTLEDHLGRAAALPRITATLAGGFSLVALLLASLGIYAVVSFTVARRTAEMGIRAALGADRARLIRAVSARTLGVAAIGLLLGLVAIRAAAPWLEGAFFGVDAFDPASVAGATVLLSLVAFVAAWIPARRAAAADPVEALRAR